MAHEGEAPQAHRTAASRHRGPTHPRSLEVAERGIRNTADFADFFSRLIGDIMSKRVKPEVGNAVCNAGGKMLKAVELQCQYGQPLVDGTPNPLLLAPGIKPKSAD